MTTHDNTTNYDERPDLGHYIRNQETRRLELHFPYAVYQSLDADDKRALKGLCLWSRSREAWISRAQLPAYWAEQFAKRLGMEDRGEEGERLTHADWLAAKAERAERRADRLDERAERRDRDGAALRADFEHYRGDIAFMTQPYIAGHSGSERFRRSVERIIGRYERGLEAYRDAADLRGRAATARVTASQAELENRAFLDRRISEREAELRRIGRQIERVTSARYQEEHPGVAWEAQLEGLEARAAEETDALGFYRACLDRVGGVPYSRENVRPGDAVLIRRRWARVERASPKTVTVSDPTGLIPFTLKYPYAEIQDHRPAGASNPTGEADQTPAPAEPETTAAAPADEAGRLF
jgi:hypothetical protein